MKNKKAFTLVEILVVVAILAILMTVIISNVESAQKKARDSKRMSAITQIQKAVRAYNIDKGHLPYGENDNSGWDLDSQDADSDGNLFIQELILEGITKAIPTEAIETMPGYRYKYFDASVNPLCDVTYDDNNYAVLATKCETDSCKGDNITPEDDGAYYRQGFCENNAIMDTANVIIDPDAPAGKQEINNLENYNNYLIYIIKE